MYKAMKGVETVAVKACGILLKQEEQALSECPLLCEALIANHLCLPLA